MNFIDIKMHGTTIKKAASHSAGQYASAATIALRYTFCYLL